jgi:hypothetical protein
MIWTSRLKAGLQTLISNFRAVPFISLNVVCNEVGLGEKLAAPFMLFGSGKTWSQERAPSLSSHFTTQPGFNYRPFPPDGGG